MLETPIFTPSQQQRLTQSIVQSLYEGILVLDGDGVIISSNGTAEMLLGVGSGALNGRFGRDFLDPEAFDLAALSAGMSHRYATHFNHPDGHAIAATVHISSFKIGELVLGLVSIAAMPLQGPLHEKLAAAERMAGLGTLTSSIAHELNTPLSVILTTCENISQVLDAQNMESEQIKAYVAMIRRNVDRSAQLVDTLRSYAHTRQAMHAESLNEIIKETLPLLADQFQNRWRVNVWVDLKPDLPPVVCDRNQMMQVLINLLSNARDAMLPGGGDVCIRTWHVADMDVVACAVEDTGRGIPDEHLQVIFDPFYTTKERGEGSGLGLYVASEIMRAHRGWIRAKNRKLDGRRAGASFIYALPVG